MKLDLGFRVTAREREAIRAGMKTYAAATKIPKLTWDEWRLIAVACAIASDHFKQSTGGQTRTPDYTKPMSEFLRVTGFDALNKDDIAAAMRCLPAWDAIDLWRATLPPVRRVKLNNPRQVLAGYQAR